MAAPDTAEIREARRLATSIVTLIADRSFTDSEAEAAVFDLLSQCNNRDLLLLTACLAGWCSVYMPPEDLQRMALRDA